MNTGPWEKSRTRTSEISCVYVILQENHDTPKSATPSPSYAEIIKKKLVDSSGSSSEDSIEQIAKKEGRKSRKEVREEEEERLKMQGNQSIIEMSLGRSKRTRHTKEVITPSLSGK